MSSGVFGLNGPTINPLAMLQARVMPQQGQDAPPAQASAPPAPPVTAPAPAPSPAGENGPSTPSDGGGGSGLGGIGSALSRALSGDGIFGDSGDEGPVNPVTGLTTRQERRQNNQSIMKIGLLLMAAGMRQSDDSRARILAGVPGAIPDQTDQINKFARNRLEMAKLRLLEKQSATNAATSAAIMSRFAGPTPAPVDQATPPVGAGTGLAPVATPSPTPESPPTATAGPVPGANPADAPAPGATPAQFTPDMIAAMPTSAPKPTLPEWQPNDDDKLVLAANQNNPAAMAKYIADQRNKMRDMKLQSQPYRKDGVGVVVDIWQGGRKIGIEKLADLPQSVIDRPWHDGSIQRDTVDDTGRVLKRETVRDPLEDEGNKAVIQTVKKNSEELNKQFRDSVQPSVKNYDRLVELEDVVRSGGTLTGKLADVQKNTIGWMASMGWLQKGDIDKLVQTGRVSAELGAAAGRFAKDNYGPQVSNQDVINAQQLLGAVSTGQPEEMAMALERIRNSERDKIQNYNAAADDFNTRIGGLKGVKADFFKANRVDKNFDEEKPWEKRARENPKATPDPAKDGKTDRPRKKVGDVTYEFDGKGWYRVQ